MRKNTGFTLIELMIVVAIISIILAFALPAYSEQMKQSRRADAKTALTTLAQLQESFYIDNGNRYAANLVGNNSLRCDTKGICLKSGEIAFSVEGYYKVTVESNDFAVGYLLKATARAAEAQAHDDNCQVFSLNSRNQKLSYNASSAISEDCW